MPLLVLHGVSKSYGALKVIDGISLAVEKGETLGILGPNGAGKTTLFNLISGDVRADQGRIEYGGRDVTALAPHQRCRAGLFPAEAAGGRAPASVRSSREESSQVSPRMERRQSRSISISLSGVSKSAGSGSDECETSITARRSVLISSQKAPTSDLLSAVVEGLGFRFLPSLRADLSFDWPLPCKSL